MTESNIISSFLGSKAENLDILERLIIEVLRDHAYWRRSFHPEDPLSITPEEKISPQYTKALAEIESQLWHVISKLKRSGPWFSPRYFGHMLSETTIASMVGYFVGMLYNSNNVTTQAAPCTVKMEIEVAGQLASMIGFNPEETWGHLTSGGTVANAEALWVARNLRYQPLAVAAMLRDPDAKIRFALPDVDLVSLNGKPFDTLNTWELFNLSTHDTLILRQAIPIATTNAKNLGSNETFFEVARQIQREYDEEIKKYSLASLGWRKFCVKVEQILGAPVPEGILLVSQAKHYSWVKLADVFGIGQESLEYVPIDENFRMNIDALERILNKYVGGLKSFNGIAYGVIGVISVCGTTEEGSIDEISKIVDLRKKFAERGLHFYLHSDAAYGGYFASMFKTKDGNYISEDNLEKLYQGIFRKDMLKDFMALSEVDSITIDPHKLGYIPYPAGAILFREKDVRDLISCHAPYVFKEGGNPEDFLGRFIFEGSKPGAAAVACYLSHKMNPLHAEGHGKMLAGVVMGTKKFYKSMLKQASDQNAKYRIFPLCEPETNVVCYVVVPADFYSLLQLNILTEMIAVELGVEATYDESWKCLISSTELNGVEYSGSLDVFFDKIGQIRKTFLLPGKPGTEDHFYDTKLVVLRSAVMNPFIGNRSDFDQIIETIINELLLAAERIKAKALKEFEIVCKKRGVQ
jgi:glutamate/tyrosine decarboxylase-like PLP-dependent enzyme